MASIRSAALIGKQLQRCLKSLRSFTDDQVRMIECDWDFMKYIKFEITPNDGIYQDRTFEFKIAFTEDYPDSHPTVTCTTPIYHPNIDYDGQEGNVCVSLFSEWTPNCEIQDVIQALLFLFYNPNVDDPLSELVQTEAMQKLYEERALKIYKDGINPFIAKRLRKNDNAEKNENNNNVSEGVSVDQHLYDDNEEIEEDTGFGHLLCGYNEDYFKVKTTQNWSESLCNVTDEWNDKLNCQEFKDKIKKWEKDSTQNQEEENLTMKTEGVDDINEHNNDDECEEVREHNYIESLLSRLSDVPQDCVPNDEQCEAELLKSEDDENDENDVVINFEDKKKTKNNEEDGDKTNSNCSFVSEKTFYCVTSVLSVSLVTCLLLIVLK